MQRSSLQLSTIFKALTNLGELKLLFVEHIGLVSFLLEYFSGNGWTALAKIGE